MKRLGDAVLLRSLYLSKENIGVDAGSTVPHLADIIATFHVS